MPALAWERIAPPLPCAWRPWDVRSSAGPPPPSTLSRMTSAPTASLATAQRSLGDPGRRYPLWPR